MSESQPTATVGVRRVLRFLGSAESSSTMGCGASSAASSPSSSTLSGFFAGQKNEPGAIKKVVFVRHANAAPRDAAATAAEFGLPVDDLPQHANAWLASDLHRPLTDKGREQAAASKASFMAAYNIAFAVASEAERATATLEIVAPEHGAKDVRGTLKELHPSQSNAPDCEKMFDTMGYGPLQRFWDDKSTGVDGATCFQKFADDVAPHLLKHLTVAARSPAAKAGADTVIVAGHAVFLNAVALATAQAMQADASTIGALMTLELGESEGIELSLTYERGAWVAALKHVTA